MIIKSCASSPCQHGASLFKEATNSTYPSNVLVHRIAVPRLVGQCAMASTCNYLDVCRISMLIGLPIKSRKHGNLPPIGTYNAARNNASALIRPPVIAGWTTQTRPRRNWQNVYPMCTLFDSVIELRGQRSTARARSPHPQKLCPHNVPTQSA